MNQAKEKVTIFDSSVFSETRKRFILGNDFLPKSSIISCKSNLHIWNKQIMKNDKMIK